MRHIPRFYVDNELFHERVFALSSEQYHHAITVLRLSKGSEVRVFNERDGEWSASIITPSNGTVACKKLIVAAKNEIGPILACCLINPTRFSFVLEKATELGVTEIFPIISQFTQYRSLNIRKCQQTILSAVEQSGRLSIPILHEVTALPELLQNFPVELTLLVGDTTGDSVKLKEIIAPKSMFLIGPEGGFSLDEKKMFSQHKAVRTFHFGSTVLRSETAAIAFLSCWLNQ